MLLPIQINKRLIVVALVLLAIGLLIVLLSLYAPTGIDWHDTFRPAAQELVLTGDPYRIEGYRYAPWTLLPFLPIAFLPERVGYAIMTVGGLAAFGWTAYRMGARPTAFAAFVLSPPVLHCLLNGNIDWLVLLGFVLPPQIGLLLIAIKPQVSSAVALFWLVEAFRKGGWREVVRVFWPVTVALGVSFLVYGLWPLYFMRSLTLWWNASLWPASIPIGLGLLVTSLRKRNISYAMGASPCLSPYVLFHSWSGALVAIVSLPYETLVVVAALWVWVLIRLMAG
jgi:hypothetical protein